MGMMGRNMGNGDPSDTLTSAKANGAGKNTKGGCNKGMRWGMAPPSLEHPLREISHL